MNRYEKDTLRYYIIIILIASIFILACMFAGKANAAEIYESHNIDEIADAIFKAEGGKGTRYPYGIKSIKCVGEKECRRICKNTIRNNIKRYNDYGRSKFGNYLKFLASRYAPIGVANDPTNLNKNWIKNVKFFLKKRRIK